MYISSCDNNKCPLVDTCIRYIENHRHKGYYTNQVETYDPDVIQINTNSVGSFNPNSNPTPICYRGADV